MKGVCVLRKLGAGRLIEEIQLRYKWVNAVTNKEVTKAPLDVLKEMVDVTWGNLMHRLSLAPNDPEAPSNYKLYELWKL